MNKGFVFAVATLIGAIVGLGMFGMPYAASKAGFFVGVVYLLVLSIVMLLLHLVIGEIVERTNGKHRLTGFIEKYLGLKCKKFIGAIIIFSLYAGLVAYIIVGGKFLSLLFPDSMSPFLLSIVFWFTLSLGVLLGIRTIGKIEFLMSGFLIFFIFALFVWGIKDVSTPNFSGFDFADFFLPYGVTLFALDGTVAIPEIRDLLKIDGKTYRRAIVLGSLLPAFFYFLFMFTVVGVSGGNTSEEALSGLVGHLGAGVVGLGAIFGILAIATSYLVLGSNLKHTFEYDWRMNPKISAALVAAVPLALFAGGIQKFIEVISFSGAIFGAIIGISVLFVYKKAIKMGEREPGYKLKLPKFILWGLVILLALGGAYEIMYLLK